MDFAVLLTIIFTVGSSQIENHTVNVVNVMLNISLPVAFHLHCALLQCLFYSAQTLGSFFFFLDPTNETATSSRFSMRTFSHSKDGLLSSFLIKAEERSFKL